MKYFTIKELTKTNTGLKNEPNEIELQRLEYLINEVLDPVREALGMPITVTSGFRTQEVNKKVGGVVTSQHCRGEAADLVCNDNAKLYTTIKRLGKYDQLIWEKGNDQQPAWVHVSYKFGINRKQELRIR
ncbi:MAG: peptidase M15 [Bacteroidales bacterium]|jgi:uncharacterized protein YcbK (DUF882 family)|nr:peptidase M15 [Bacteroidales bacterium]